MLHAEADKLDGTLMYLRGHRESSNGQPRSSLPPIASAAAAQLPPHHRERNACGALTATITNVCFACRTTYDE